MPATKMTRAEALADLVKRLAAMKPLQRERWMRRYDLTDAESFALMQNVRLVWAKEAAVKLKKEMETPHFRAVLESLGKEVAR